MKRNNLFRKILLVPSFVVLLASLAPAAYSENPCSLARAVGTYGFGDSGTVVGVGPRAAVGQLSFDAAKNLTGNVNASLNGNVTQTTLSGTYAVSPDCSGTASFAEFDQSGNLILTATVAIAWDANMQEARFLFTSVALADGTPLSTVVNGNARKLVP